MIFLHKNKHKMTPYRYRKSINYNSMSWNTLVEWYEVNLIINDKYKIYFDLNVFVMY